jgi:hypothetical protein
LILLLCLASSASASGFTLIETISNDHASGVLTDEEKALYTVAAILNPETLPDHYLILSQQIESAPTRCATPVLKDVLVDLDNFSPATQAAIRGLLLRPSTTYSYTSPGGFFRLHYDTIPADNGVPGDDIDLSGVPDFIEKVAAYLDTTANSHLDMGYLTPPDDGAAGGDERYDVYFAQSGNYGVCVPEASGPEPWDDRTSYLVLHRTFLGFPANDDPEGNQWGSAKSTVAHEYHHAVQYAYDFSEETWYQEMDAMFIEDIIFDASNDGHNYLDGFFDLPEKSLMENSLHMYSCFPYLLYLAQTLDTSLMRAVWEGSLYTPSTFQTLSDSIEGRYGWTQDSAFAEFAAWNYITSTRDDGNHHEEAAEYPLVAIGRSYNHYPVAVSNSPANPSGYGTCYIEFYPEDDLSTLRLMFNGSDSRDWAAFLIKSTAEDVHTIEKLSVEPPTYLAIDTILNFEDYYRITLLGVNLTEYSSSAPFSYSARTFAPYEVHLQAQRDDSAVYSGGMRAMSCTISNPSPLNDVYALIVYDDQGWLPLDTMLVPVLSGAEAVVSVEVRPPMGTPLGSTSQVYFEAVSYGNPAVISVDSTLATTALYRGDINFTGSVDISDLIHFVMYAFQGGPEPLPVLESANHDCVRGIDIADIIHLVMFMFQGGPDSPCNPY